MISCGDDEPGPRAPDDDDDDDEAVFYFGVDLSYVNQLIDKGAVFREGGTTKNPYDIFADNGANLARFRLWHNPTWVRDVYDSENSPLYSGITDVTASIAEAKSRGLEVLLDFHYSDTWADPGNQQVPNAWRNITSVQVLEDSIYNYTKKTLQFLDSKGLMPELVQLGNEINCGLLYDNAVNGFPHANLCEGGASTLMRMLNAAVKGVQDASEASSVKPKIIIHVADPADADWFFEQLSDEVISGFDIIGISYYALWHRDNTLAGLSSILEGLKNKFKKDVMIVETAYPWTSEFHDTYSNQFGNDTPLGGFPFTPEGQLAFMIRLTEQVKEGGGIGVVYWEPEWISIPTMKDLWGTGSSWENATMFDFDGNALPSLGYMKHDYGN